MEAKTSGLHIWRRPIAAIGGLGVVIAGALLTSVASPSAAEAGWPWKSKRQQPACGHSGCTRGHCNSPEGWAGQWYWMRSPDQEQRVVMSLYNRYCIRCHGIDGRGVWDIPDVPDFTDPRWQASRPDRQIVHILMEGRGAAMPTFRGTLNLEEACAMARYLRSFVPGTEVPRPEVGRVAAARRPASGGEAALPQLPAATNPVPSAR
jgi:mono/diheme cytochrome c family protein